MSPRVIAASLVVLVLSAAPALSAPHSSGPGAAPPPKAPARPAAAFDDTRTDIIFNGGDPNQMLCVDRAIVGSRLIRHICYTREQWAMLKAQQHRNTDKMMRIIGESAGIPEAGHNSTGGNDPN